jgi:hypothetical protein
MKFNLHIPPELAHLKRDERGYPIPWFAPLIDGKYNFRIQDAVKRDYCMTQHKCPICGKKLIKGAPSYVILGPLGLKNRITSDAPMHQVCAEFSLRACPHLYYYKATAKEDGSAFPEVIQAKPDRLFLTKISSAWYEWDPYLKRNHIHFKVLSYRTFP